MGTIVKLNTVQEYNMAMGVETLHPLVSVVDFSTLKSLKHGRKNFWLLLCFSETAQVWGIVLWAQHVRLPGRHVGSCGSWTSGRN